MATSSINTVSGSGTKNYMAGLASGMDTESIVQNLLAGTQSKIDKQTGLKQQLGWKQDIYREMITKINNLGDKYLSYYGKGSTNLMSTSLYNTMTGTSSSSAVRIGAVSSGAVGSMNISSIEQLATACTVKSSGKVTGTATGSAADFTKFVEGANYSFSVNLDGVNKTIEFTGGATQTETLDNINQTLYRNFGTALGMAANGSSIELVKLNSNGTVSGDAIDSSRRVIIDATGTEAAETIKNLGFEGGFSNKLDYGTSLKNMNFATPLQGGQYEFKINGVTITGLSGDSTLSDVISAINNSDAGVRVSYSSAADGFVMESSATGDISQITMSQTHGNLLTMMFGVSASGVESSLLQQDIQSQGHSNMDALLSELNAGKDKTFEFTVDGKTVSVKLPGKTGDNKYKDEQSVIAEMNSQIEKQFGTGKIKFSLVADGSDATKNFVTISSAVHQVGLTADQVDADADVAKAFGFTTVCENTFGDGTKLSDAGLSGTINVNGYVIDLAAPADKTIANLVSELNSAGCSATYADGRLEILSTGSSLSITSTGADGQAAIKKLFGSDSINMTPPAASTVAHTTGGKNAVLTVNGTRIERNSNTFELDGITLELKEKYDSTNPPISLTTTRDTAKIIDSVKGFVEDYNKLVDELSEYVSEKATYKQYAPLTEAQKKEMSDKEVELWEEKSKTGLLRNDSNVNSFLSDMRMALYSSVEGAGLSLYDIGVETSDNWRDNGKLIIDEDALASAVATNADAICTLFTDRDQGLGVKMQNAIKSAANVSSGSPGSMVRYAGTKDVLTTSNTLYDEMKRITETLSNLNTKYQLEKTRYWNQFNSMEQAISNMNSQSSWLGQQFSS